MPLAHIEYRLLPPPPSLTDFVESFWMLVNHSDREQEVVVLPDGRVDVFFSSSPDEGYHVTLLGLGSEPSRNTVLPGTIIFAVSFKLPAVEYILGTSIASLMNAAVNLPHDFWGIAPGDINDFDAFCRKLSDTLEGLIKEVPDEKKRKLFDLIYSSHGSMTVSGLSREVSWSSRQINRYFNQWFGLSLKAYCNILRFRASFEHINEGRLFPEQNFTDQAHFIRDVKKYSGVVPRELRKNPDDRFIQFSTLRKK